ncbi:MAG: hypothetical protein H6574_05210 [Lewinellaceae bacterium]|nr:hypothetical protein [Saprospiraceae bacterium]MCB9316551.1 hypothetical protein [Lewinellaceae bacterium]MCB9330461.1 hypothetical protein [Lewinellaceae bacterium]
MTRYTETGFFICFLLANCLMHPGCTVDPNKLTGTWQAVAFFENGKTVSAPLDSVRLYLTNNAGYAFKSQGYYQEAGSYRVAASYLFLEDTTVVPKKERTVKVLYLSSDTLKIEMKKSGNRQVLFFKRQS